MDFNFVVQETGGSSHHDEVFERITHPALRRVIDVVLVFSGFAMGFVMLAGAGANLEQQFGLPAWAGSALCAVLVILTAFLDFDRIMKVIGVFTPMIIVAITILTIYSLATPHPSVAELNTAATQVTPALPNLWLSTINYFALCVVNGIAMAFVLGGSVLRIGEARRAGRIGGTIIALVIGVVAVGYAASLMGFKKLIGGMYPIIGWLGVALLVVLAVGWLRERSAVLREENLRRKLIRVLVRKQPGFHVPSRRVAARAVRRHNTVAGTDEE